MTEAKEDIASYIHEASFAAAMRPRPFSFVAIAEQTATRLTCLLPLLRRKTAAYHALAYAR